MAFLDSADYDAALRTYRLTQIVDGNTVLLDTVEGTAMQIIRDALHSRYDVDAIFATSGAGRPAQVVRWMVVLVVYYIFERIPDKMVPEHVSNDYEMLMEFLKDLEDGKRDTELPRLLVDSQPKTKFVWGSNSKRTHDLY